MRSVFSRSTHATAVLAVLAVLGMAPPATAEEAFEVSGVVRSSTGQPLAGAAVAPEGGAREARTDAEGVYRLRLSSGEQRLRVSHAGYAPAVVRVIVSSDTSGIDVTLAPMHRFSEQVVVQAIRADERTPVTKRDIGPAELDRLDHGQEMPFLLEQAPSITHYSDTGIGAGYSYFYLRGIQQTRINMTLDGAPLNEPEDSALYFADFGDFASALDSIQIQRGVGTSSVGTASYGGSINFASVALAEEPSLAVEAGAGSFGTGRASLAAQSGRFGPGLALYARASYRETDGFRDHSGVIQRTVYFGASRPGERSFLKLFGFAGRERSQLAFFATEREVLEREARPGEPDPLRSNPLTPEERDRFGQNFVQAQYTHAVGSSSSLSGQAYSNWAGGWYRIWDDPFARTALLEYQLDWRLLGGQLAFRHARGRLSLTGGLHANDFESDHARAVVGGGRDYANRGFKSEASGFVKLGYDAGRWHLYGDAQLRHARFRYEGEVDLGSVEWTFFNPKLGARFDLTPRLALYASVGRATREPTRMDMLSGEDDATVLHDLRAVEPERVVDVEAGAEYRRPRLSLQANLYAMEFRHEIAPTGELSEIGLPLRRNVGRSYRRGLELDLRWEPLSKLRVTSSANLSRNRIREWTQFYDVYDPEGGYLASEGRLHRNVSPLLTPSFVANLGLEGTITDGLEVGLQGRYVSESFLDNTSQDEFATPSFFGLDASATLSLARWVDKCRPRLRLQINNVLDNRRIWPSGYSYLFFTRDAAGRDTPGGIAYFYPQATRSVLVMLDLEL